MGQAPNQSGISQLLLWKLQCLYQIYMWLFGKEISSGEWSGGKRERQAVAALINAAATRITKRQPRLAKISQRFVDDTGVALDHLIELTGVGGAFRGAQYQMTT